jgi:hypothetical protein
LEVAFHLGLPVCVFEIVQGSPAKRGKSGAKDHASVEQIGISDDTLGKCRLALIDIGGQQFFCQRSEVVLFGNT